MKIYNLFSQNMVHKLRIAVVCSSNQNRSMEAHNFLSKRGFNVKSYGSGTHVKLPGSAADKPNIYTFDTPYQQMYDELLKKDYALYPEYFDLFPRRKQSLVAGNAGLLCHCQFRP
ncbi:RNA polymerase II subunit A C-terminal domain phosphatase SSU72 [Exaiptasia diaphana]|nr:RNA polymerase II subunit A C-terminal domain phosphatase SSU72 [Exaiptasia diaphana]